VLNFDTFLVVANKPVYYVNWKQTTTENAKGEKESKYDLISDSPIGLDDPGRIRADHFENGKLNRGNKYSRVTGIGNEIIYDHALPVGKEK